MIDCTTAISNAGGESKPSEKTLATCMKKAKATLIEISNTAKKDPKHKDTDIESAIGGAVQGNYSEHSSETYCCDTFIVFILSKSLISITRTHEHTNTNTEHTNF